MRPLQQLHLDRLVHFHAVAKHGSLRRVDELVTYCVDDPARTLRAPIAFLLEELDLAASA